MVYEYEARVVRVIDGDTVVLHLEREFPVDIDFGFRILDRMVLRKSTEMSFRLAGINTPELGGETKEAGERAKARLAQLLSSGTIRAVTSKPDKYGRWLVDLYVTFANNLPPREVHVNAKLVEEGLAVVYRG